MHRLAVAVLLPALFAPGIHAACPDDVQVAAFVSDYRDLQVGKGFGPDLMELPDLQIDPAEKLNGPALVSINMGARMGALGDPIPMQTTDAFIDALASMTVVLLEDGREIARGPGAAIMGHPLNSAMWIAHDLERSGLHLRAGDLLSLGTFLPFQPPKPGTTVSVQYLGLPGDPSVTVSFK